jgi:DNA-binding NarL/FixJ family response regulator
MRGVKTMPSVLIVEDNEFFRTSFREILKMHLPSLSIEESADGVEAMQRILAERPDIVFMDIHLPGANGLHLTREIKWNYPEIVIGIFTSYNLPEYRQTAFQYGADYFFIKDAISGAEIASMIEVILSNKAGHPTLEVTVH